MTEFESLRALSARVGIDPLLVQAAGGNTSIKQDGVMWIKASGTWLRDALVKDIFVPLDLARLEMALAADDPDCESCTPFVRVDLNAKGLKPSIETSVHGLMSQKIVVHVHCVNTIALAIRHDGAASIGNRLQGFNWVWIPYARPGLQLSRAIGRNMHSGADVLILGNHGLAVAGETVAETEHLLARVVAALRVDARPPVQPDLEFLTRMAAGTDYVLPQDAACHAAATDALSARLGLGGVYYPDHVVFLGEAISGTTSKGGPAAAFPGKGVLVHTTAKPAVEPMLRCLGDVFRRVPEGAVLNPLTAGDINALLNWDAEKYRQTLKH
jgi:rhamnose utilization protein RhaD (predicted bifunctional aldolase and dehydrogenase)